MLLCFAALAAKAETVVIEAESFDGWGGWSSSQRRPKMSFRGFPFLGAL